MSKSAKLVLFSSVLVFVFVQQNSAQQQSVGQSPLASAVVNQPPVVDNRYRIGPGDVIAVTVLDYPQLSSDSIKVDRAGMILLPLIAGEIQASCHTEGELAQEIGRRYLKYLKEPQVRVFVKEYQSQPVAVIGAVNTPGRFQLQRRIRLLELLTFVNGPAERAGETIQIIHTEGSMVCNGDNTSAVDSLDTGLVTLKLRETLKAVDRANPFVEAGDIITVLDADQYYVMGNVPKPSAYPLKEKMTVTQAIANAGGVLPDSQTDRVRIIRRADDGINKTEIVVDLKEAWRNGQKEVLLQPNDIIEVPRKGGVGMAFKNAFKVMIPGMASQLPLRVIY